MARSCRNRSTASFLSNYGDNGHEVPGRIACGQAAQSFEPHERAHVGIGDASRAQRFDGVAQRHGRHPGTVQEAADMDRRQAGASHQSFQASRPAIGARLVWHQAQRAQPRMRQHAAQRDNGVDGVVEREHEPPARPEYAPKLGERGRDLVE